MKDNLFKVSIMLLAIVIWLAYPFSVRADILGNTAGATNGATTRVACSPFTATTNGTITSVSAFNNASGGGNWQGAIYDSDGASSRPNTLLGNANSDTAIPASSDWSTSTLVSSVSITSDHVYYVCEWLSGATANYVYAAGGATDLATSNSTSYATWPTPFGFNSNSSRLLKIYATYTPTSSGGTTNSVASVNVNSQVNINGRVSI